MAVITPVIELNYATMLQSKEQDGQAQLDG